MRIAFYAPMKPPDHPIPSGDRLMARLFMAAFQRGGHEVGLISRLRSWQSTADPSKLAELRDQARAETARILAAIDAGEIAKPDYWFTYHLYYKAPDLLGPEISRALAIPYVVSEASLANKRAGGPWDTNHRAVLSALEQASALVNLNPLDAECLTDPSKVHHLPPFLDTGPYRQAASNRARLRASLRDALDLDPDVPWLLTVAMMREGDKLSSYLELAKALRQLQNEPWQLLVVGDGAAAERVQAAFSSFDSGRIHFLGEKSQEALLPLYAASDLLVWPAINEAFGMAILEAQAAGLPAVAGATPGVSDIVGQGTAGYLTPPGDASAFAEALGDLITSPAKRQNLSKGALRRAETRHDISAASHKLDQILAEASAKC